MSDSILNFLWSQSWQMALLFLAVGLLCYLARNWSAHWRYLLCLVVLLKCLVPSLIPMRVPDAVAAPFNGLMQHVTVSMERSVGAAHDSAVQTTPKSAPPAVSATPSRQINWQLWLVVCWALGAAGFLFIALVKAIRIQRGLKRSRTQPNLELECEFLALAVAIGLKRRPKLCLIRGLSQPFVWGVLRGAIYLPENFEQQGTAQQRRLVLGHELAHVLRWDALVNLIQIVVQAVFFFHPLVWWLNRIIRHEREKCCDEMAIASLQADSHDYGSAILERLANYYEPSCPSSALAISGHAKDLEDRIKTVLRPERVFRRRPTAPAFAAALGIAMVALPWHWRGTVAAATVVTREAAPVMVDLSSQFNADLQKTWLPGFQDHNLSALTSGKQTLAGVSFNVRGLVQLAGAEATTSNFPAMVPIRINGHCRQFQLLHACVGSEQPGVEIAAMRVRYADGQQRELQIRYGEQVRDWQFFQFKGVSDTNTVMAWTGSDPFMRAHNGAVRLYRTTLVNPRPQAAIVGLDYISRRSKAAPFLVALTVN